MDMAELEDRILAEVLEGEFDIDFDQYEMDTFVYDRDMTWAFGDYDEEGFRF
jgi:hypothetical protein